MKIKLFALTAATSLLVSASNSYAHTHFNQASSQQGLTLGGFYDFQMAAREQDQDHTTYSREFLFKNNTRIDFTFRKIADQGFAYGAYIELQADTSPSERNSGFNADKTYLFLESRLGKIELGSNIGSTEALTASPHTILAGTGGIDGDYELYVHFPHGHSHGGGHSHASIIHKPALPLTHDHGPSDDATKISYYTPRISGFQFGVSFIPDSGNTGTAAGFTSDNDDHQFENVIDLGLNYKAVVANKIDVEASVTSQFGNAEAAEQNDIAAYEVALKGTYDHAILAASYGYWGDSTLEATSTNDDGRYWSVGLGYDLHDFYPTLAYLSSELDENEVTVFSAAVDYNLIPGLTPYVEANFFDVDVAATDIDDTNGTVILAGARVKF